MIFDIPNIYKLTAIILGTGSFIMGITLLTLRSSLKNSGTRYQSALLLLSVAMFVLSIVNLLEYAAGIESEKEFFSLSVVIFTASIEMFLLFSVYMSMLSKEFLTKRRIYFELGCIALFTTPAMCVDPLIKQPLPQILFAIGIVFYIIKLICNYFEYRKEIQKTKAKIENYISDDSSLWLSWTNNSFGMVMIIGTTSVFIPLTNLTVLVGYNLFLLFGYFYIYISVIRNIYLFDKSMSILEDSEIEQLEMEPILTPKPALPLETVSQPVTDWITSHQSLLNQWIAKRGYAVPGITATEVAHYLTISRTKLSLYLKEQDTNFYQWIAKLRIEDAKKQLLEDPNKTIYEIAISVGIEDRDNFRRAFQRYTGLSPREYRKQNRN